VPGRAWLLYQFGDFLVYGTLRNRYGFSRIRVAYAAGEALGAEILRFFRSLGVNLKQLYGQTEASLWIAAQPDGEIYADTVGRPIPGVEVRIADNREALVRSPGVFAGYYKDPDLTAAVKTPESWVHTKDTGILDAKTGHLKINGRSEGERQFAPRRIEHMFKN
jgi:long-chain acyl-CoA synthetase